MARQRNPKREWAKKMWLDSGGKKQLKEIAEELDLSPGQIRKWKSEDKWTLNSNSNVTNQKERYESLKGNHSARGNPGGSAPSGNKNAVSHGLFAKWLPDDTKALMDEIYTSTPADIIWNNIMIQYSAIIRSQKIMNVKDEFDTTDEIIETQLNPMFEDKNGKPVQTKAVREFQYAWDKQATYLQAMSRAMGTLSNLIKQFVSLADENDSRRKKLTLMDAQIAKLKADTPPDATELKGKTIIVDDWSDEDANARDD